MPRPIAIVSLAVCLGALPGCERLMSAAKEPPPAAKPAPGGVGVVDLDAVAKRIGRDIQMNEAVQGKLEELNAELQNLQKSLGRLLDDKRDALGDDATEEQQGQLAKMQARGEQQLLEARRTAEAKLAVYRQKLVDEFREEARPVIRAVAAARGLSIVVPRNNGLLLSIDPAVELTDDVAAKLLEAGPPPADEPEQTVEKPRKRRPRESARG